VSVLSEELCKGVSQKHCGMTYLYVSSSSEPRPPLNSCSNRASWGADGGDGFNAGRIYG
jgi:hypothetical protein